MGLDYVDIFYSHRADPDTPLEETMGALDTAVAAGKALYAGISSYSPERTRAGRRDPARAGHAAADPPAVVLDAQPLDRARRTARHARASSASAASRSRRWRRACSPTGTSTASRRDLAGRQPGSLSDELLTEENLDRVRALNAIAERRGQSLAQLALAWALRDPRMTSPGRGAAASPSWRTTSPRSTRLDFTAEELAEIDQYARRGRHRPLVARSAP